MVAEVRSEYPCEYAAITAATQIVPNPQDWGEANAVDTASLAKLYQYELSTLDCLESIGWDVPADPPAREVYVERFNSEHAWSA